MQGYSWRRVSGIAPKFSLALPTAMERRGGSTGEVASAETALGTVSLGGLGSATVDPSCIHPVWMCSER